MNKKINEKINEKELKFGNPFQIAVIQNIGASIQDKTILVIRDYRNAIWYARKNKVIYLTDNEDLFNKFNNEIVDKKFGSDDKAMLINNFDSELNTIINNLLMELNMPKFDIIIGNPPYEGKYTPLYLQILEKMQEMSDKIVWLCPSQWVKSYHYTDGCEKVRRKVSKTLIQHKHIKNVFGNNAIFANDLGIYVFDKKGKSFENIDDIFYEKFSNKTLAKSIGLKLKNYKDNVNNHSDRTNKEVLPGYWCNITRIRGNVHESKPLWDWTTLFSEENKNNFTYKPAIHNNHINFKTVTECKNFVNYIDSDIVNFSIFFTKDNNNITPPMLSMIPWLGDYKHEWTEDMIAKELGLTAKEVEYIHEEMKGFGWKAQPTTRKKRERK